MSKFCLKTATTLLPIMNGSEEVTKQLIDSIELYDTLLDAESKTSLIQYVLKTRLSQNAKLRLKTTYATTTDLIRDIKKHFLTVRSAAALSQQLINSKQAGKSIDDFGINIESLLTQLTISQAEGNDGTIDTLRAVNEKLAVNVFANGLQNSELRMIIKARNYTKLADAVKDAKEEEPPRQYNQPLFFMRGRNDFRRGSNNRGNRGSQQQYNQQTRYQGHFQNSSRGQNRQQQFQQGGNFNNRGFQNYRHNNNRSNRGNYRSYQNNNNNYNRNNRSFDSPRVYLAENTETEHVNEPSNIGQSSSADDTFFRASRE